MIKAAYATLILMLMISVSAYAQNEVEPSSNGNDSDDYLLSEMELEEELWGLDSALFFLESSWMDVLCDALLGLCLYLEVTDEEMYEIFPDLWELDYEPYLFWEE